MPDESRSKPPVSTSNDPNSLADLLPEYFDEYPAAPGTPSTANGRASSPVGSPTPPRQTPLKTASRKSNFNYIVLGLVALGGIVVLPMLIFGIFFVIAKTEPARTTYNIGDASTPLATVYSVTPGAANSTPAPQTSAGNNAACPVQAAFGQVELYSCAKPLQSGGTFSVYFSPAETQLVQDGQNGPPANRSFAVSGDSPAKVLSFYASLMAAQGYALSGSASNGLTPLGNYTAATYSKNGQQIQVVALSINKASPDGQVNAGQTLIRLSSS